MQRKSLALVAIAVTLLTMLFLQLTVAQAATPRQTVAPSAGDEPVPLAQPIRIRIKQSIPLTLSLAPAAELSPTATLTATDLLTATDAAANDVVTTTEEAAPAELAVTAEVTETAEAAPAEGAAATESVTATATVTAPEVLSSVPVTLEIELDFVVTQTLTTTVPASATIQLPDFQTRTVPIEVVVAPLADGEVIVEIVPVVEATPEPTASAEVTATEVTTAEVTPIVTSTLAAAVNGIPVINTTVTLSANLRSGPATTFEIVSEASPGQPVQIAAISEDGGWYLLATGAWIATFLVDDQPANVPVVNDEILAAIQGTLPEPTPTPEATATPEPAATGPVSSTVTVDANLRSGPGTTFDVIGGTVTGQVIGIVGRNADGTWFRLDNGGWVLGTLVANPPALESVPVVNDDGTPVEPAAAPAETPATGLGGLLPTPTPQAPGAAAPAADLDAYLTSAAELVSQFDVVLNSVDALLAEANSNPALISDSAWTTRMNAALTLLRRTSASVGELDVPAGGEAIQTQLETAAASYIEAAQALGGALQAADAALLVDADAKLGAATANLTAAETAIIAAQGQ